MPLDRHLLAALALCGGTVLAASPATAEPAPPPAAATPAADDTGACGVPLSPATRAAWDDAGGRTGRLGCPAGPESPSSPSPSGAGASVAVFGSEGEIVRHLSGPRAGQAYAVSGCFYRLYVQFGGTSGWLGLPTAEPQNNPDGYSQAFEGGFMRYARALDTCEAVRSEAPAPAPVAASAGELVPLDLFEKPASGDRQSLASAGSVAAATADGYLRLRPQARVLSAEQDGAARLKLFENDDKGLHEAVATAQGEREALAEGYVFEAGQGWVWTDPHPGALALKTWKNPAGAVWLTAGPDDEREAAARGYVFERIEGYAASPAVAPVAKP